MKTRINIAFSRFSTKEKLLIKDIFQKMEDSVYSDETGFGYKNLSIDNNIIVATLIKRTYTSILGFSPDSNTFEKIDIPIFDEILFYIDLKKELLYTQGAYSNINKVKSALRNTFDFHLVYSDLKISPTIVMEKLVNDINYEIEEVVIQQFKYQNGIIGKYIVKITNQSNGKELVNKHIDDILKLAINFLGDEEYYIIISSNGSISIKCNEDDLFVILENFKDRIYG